MSRRFLVKDRFGFPVIIDKKGEDIGTFQSQFDYAVVETLADKMNMLDDEIRELKEEQNRYFVQVMDLLLKYQHLFNREMADEVLDELGIELTEWFE